MKLQDLPAIGAPLEGGLYAGVTTRPSGEVYALILLADKPTKRLDWSDAMAWARELGHGADAPSRVESAMLFANLRGQFEEAWHWTNEQCAGNDGYAWYQTFSGGNQNTCDKSYEGRVRAVRSIPLTT